MLLCITVYSEAESAQGKWTECTKYRLQPTLHCLHVKCNAISYEEDGFCALQFDSIHCICNACNIVQHIAIHLRYEEGYIWWGRFVEIHTIDTRRDTTTGVAYHTFGGVGVQHY